MGIIYNSLKIGSNDRELLANIISRIEIICEIEAKKICEEITNFHSPVDKDVLLELKKLGDLSKSKDLYTKISDLKNIWELLVEKSIKCLRYFDQREPYLEYKNKQPQSYGVEELVKYYNEFADFESLLYGSNHFYRDHVIHLFRTWLIGLNILINCNHGKKFFFEDISIEGVDKSIHVNFFECISMWTIISLCHDLGYPLEKFQNIIKKTKKMMEYLVTQPEIHQDINFSGTQDKINDFIVRMISSKMKKAKKIGKKYKARIQSKYYIKYSKSLENYSHGIVSSIIIYKALLYFLESDYSFHDDYLFNFEDAKQFYIRRDILRGIASHTCKDIYHMKSRTFPLLLIVSDELQDWGRKNWTSFYSEEEVLPESNFKLSMYNASDILIEVTFQDANQDRVIKIINSLHKQYDKFKKLFRDGQDTKNRDFNFRLDFVVGSTKEEPHTSGFFYIPKDEAATFTLEKYDNDLEDSIKNLNLNIKFML